MMHRLSMHCAFIKENPTITVSERLRLAAGQVNSFTQDLIAPEIIALVEAKADLDYKNDGGKSLLFSYVSYDHKKVVTCLLDNGVGLNDEELGLGTVLCKAKSPAMVELLLSRGADLGWRSHFGKSVLHSAALHHSPHVVDAFCRAGLDPNLLDDEGRSAIEVSMNWLQSKPDFKEHMKKIGVFYCYGACMEKGMAALEKKDPTCADRLRALIAHIDLERKGAYESLAALVASVFDESSSELVAQYFGSAGPSPQEIEGWDALICTPSKPHSLKSGDEWAKSMGGAVAFRSWRATSGVQEGGVQPVSRPVFVLAADHDAPERLPGPGSLRERSRRYASSSRNWPELPSHD
jgi:hypothetical protein